MSGPEHAPLAPSAAHRWVECPGSVRMCQQFPGDPDSPHAADGTAAHWVMAQVLEYGRPLDFMGVGTLAPNGVPITEEMLDGAEMYVEAVRDTFRLVEERIDCPAIHPDCWGTPDTYGEWDTGIYIDDYKFGHRHVEVAGNWQLITYAAGVCHGMAADTPVHLRIVQPRSYHRDGPVRTWSTTVRELSPYWYQLHEAARAAMEPDAPLNTGAHCRDCTARVHCPANQAAGMSWAEESVRGLPLEMTPAEIGLELRIVRTALARLEARASGLEEVALSMAPGGVPGWRIEAGAGRERWAVPVGEVIALGQMLGVDVSKPGALTPKQAIKAGLPAEVVRGITETPAGALRLVEDDGSLARRVFGGAS